MIPTRGHLWNLLAWLAVAVLVVGCGKSGTDYANPLLPAEQSSARHAMWFGQPQTLFGGGGTLAADVDLASVVWGQVSAGSSGDIVVFDDDTSWAVAVAIQDQPGSQYVQSQPYLRFLRQDNQTQQGSFPVWSLFPNPNLYCRLPKVDCTYLGDDQLEVVVAFRYGSDNYDCSSIPGWNVKVTMINFGYRPGYGWGQIGPQSVMNGAGMANPGTGETHPDICYDQNAGDIYLAWTRVICDGIPTDVEVLYARHQAGDGPYVWQGPWSLEAGTNWGDFDPWYVSLDVGLVAGLGEFPQRVVGFAYTGLFPEGTDYWGFRPVVGWFNPGDDDDHEPYVRLIVPAFDPREEGDEKFDAGLIKVDIPGDNAPSNGGAVVFVQDTCYPSTGSYEVYGISSLDYSAYTWVSAPDTQEFDQATWPSLAIHNSSGDTASVTYFAMDTQTPTTWQAWATHWWIDSAGDVAAPTEVDAEASGQFSLDILNFMRHNWGTSSSLVDMSVQGNNRYWAAWSDRVGPTPPNMVRGCSGWADIQ